MVDQCRLLAIREVKQNMTSSSFKIFCSDSIEEVETDIFAAKWKKQTSSRNSI